MPVLAPDDEPFENLGELLAAMDPDELARFLASCSPEELTLAEDALGAIGGQDRYFPDARPKQLPPEGAWSIWVLMAGRGFGKSVTGAEWIVEQALTLPGDYAVVAPTAAAGRDLCMEGRGQDGKPSGIISVLDRRGRRPTTWNRSLGELRLENGSQIKLLSAEEPERARGWNLRGGWCDELGSWPRPDAFDQLRFALRVGEHPRLIVTTTPRPTGLIRNLIERAITSEAVAVTRGSTWENRDNLSGVALAELEDRYGGTRLGRQELEGELLDDVEGALWKRSDILPAPLPIPKLARIMVGVDPSTWGADTGAEHDTVGHGIETGIVVAGVTETFPAVCYVLEDLSGRHSPDEWGRIAVNAQQRWSKTAPTWIVPETNAGGAMVTNTLRSVDPSARIFTQNGKPGVRASQGKRARAEPVAALYEQHRCFHVGSFEILSDQMCSWDASESYSPDRIDALVWAITALKPWSGAAGIAKAPERRPGKPKPSVRATNLGSPQRVGRPRTRGNSSLR